MDRGLRQAGICDQGVHGTKMTGGNTSVQSLVRMKCISLVYEMEEAAMLLAQIEGFVAIARAGNLSRAAATLFLTQPALTARLRALETELGAELFVRTARGMRLNDAGRTYLPHAVRALAVVREGCTAVGDLRSGASGELLIGAAPAISTYVLPTILKAFRVKHPLVRLGVRTGHSEEVLEMVLREDVQVGLARPIRHTDIELIPLYEDEMVLAVAARHPFAAKGRIKMESLADEQLILFDRTSSFHELTNALFREAGVVPRGVMELDNIEAAKKMVQQGFGVALLPRIAIETELRTRVLRPVRITDADPPRRPVVALRRADAGSPLGPVAGFLATLDELRTHGELGKTTDAPPSRGRRPRKV